MQVVKTISEIKKILQVVRAEKRIIGFVPTMGALHDGHLSLVEKANHECDFVVVSIFVNPTQFNNQEDFKKYPRLYNEDIIKLKNSASCDVVFLPDEKEMYPEPDYRHFDLGYFEEIMEGKYRPGHFQGVVKIVTKLFDIINPNKAYFGKKDYQQLLIVKKIVKDFNYPIEIIGCDIVRENHGLAMSSRNLRLLPEDFKNAGIIYEALNMVKEWINHKYEPSKVCLMAKNYIEKVSPFRVEYVELADSETLISVKNYQDHKSIHCFVAVYCNNVRLIDNIEIKL